MTFQVSTLSQKDFVMVQITDTHLLEYPHLEFVGMQPEQSFRAVIDLMRQQHSEIDLIVHTGDLAQNPTPVTYHRYLEHMNTLGIPFFHTPGNHDDVAYFPFHETEPSKPTVVEVGNWRVILLNSAQPERIDGKIADIQLQQLTQLLTELKDCYVIIACHHHPFAMQSAWIDQHKLKNSSDLLETIEPFNNVKAIVCGHVHQDSINTWQGVEFLSTPSTCIQFKPKSDKFALDEEHPGYRYIRLKSNGEIETQVYRLSNSQRMSSSEVLGYD
ncbi:metallophosphatase [Acinetobacter venetianus]|uniref:3',5'-cyclic-AMP phosphodiesterase n=1 Tax=Acinetobacter venetianus TaxID=52133 RepID=UPI000775B829|nr:3',5'-cyclic-AMP phosphodiesterase [Acinetobacter venetianus]KXO86356.1 metallophosphatase [Acinetobacter venetianus]